MSCPSRQSLRSFRKQQLPEGERRLVEQHLSECRSCRRILVDDLRRQNGHEAGRDPEPIPDEILRRVRDLVPAERPSRQRIWLPLAAVLVAVIGGFLLFPGPQNDTVLRDLDPVSDGISPLVPEPSEQVQGTVLFRWTEVPKAANYRLVILAGDGSRLMEQETDQTEIRIDLGALPAQEVFWHVEARLPGGDRLSTRPRALILEDRQ